MVTKTFPARVANGRLQYDESLAAFEGQQVHITLLASGAIPADPVNRQSDCLMKLRTGGDGRGERDLCPHGPDGQSASQPVGDRGRAP